MQVQGDRSPEKPTTEEDAEHWNDWVKAFGPASWSNWALFVAALWAGMMALRTLSAVTRQSDIMDRQTKLAEAGMKQWVELDGWEATASPYAENTLLISFSVVNPTSFLLLLKHGALRFEIMPHVEQTFAYRQLPLAPNKPLRFQVSLQLTPLKMNTFQTNTLGVSFEMEIVFISALEQVVSQSFDALLRCSLHKTNLETSVVIGKPQREAHQGQRPKPN